jgi:hypothetical protein
MQFLCVVYVDRELEGKLSPAEKAEFDRENKAYGERLEHDHRAVMFSALHEPETATLVRSREGRVSMTDGPYVETKEHLAGYIVLDVKDRQEALDMLDGCPIPRIGTLELRASRYVAPIGRAR